MSEKPQPKPTIEEARAAYRQEARWMALWRQHGGGQHGPHTETVTMPLASFFGFMRAATSPTENADEA